MKAPDPFVRLEELDDQQLTLVLQMAGARDNLSRNASRNRLLADARDWAVDEKRQQRLLAEIGRIPGAGRPPSRRPSRFPHPFAARRQALVALGNEYGNLDELLPYYIQPDIQLTCPLDHGGPTASPAERVPAFRYIADFTRRRFTPDPGRRCLFILGDAGMGKTSLLLMLKARHLTPFLPQRCNCELLKLGRDTLDRIDAVPDPSQTVLLLDSLDEDPLAREHAGGVSGRLADIMARVRTFHRVIITCRTQYFPRDSASLHEAGYVRLGDHESPLRHLALFSDAQVERYLRRRFPRSWHRAFRQDPQLAPAREAARAMETLSLRPLLLTYIQDFVSLDGQPRVDYHNSYAVHRHLMDQWLRREANKVDEEGRGLPTAEGWQVSVALAAYLARHDRKRIRRDELLAVPALEAVDRFNLEARSLVNRTADDHFQFAHRTIQEFLLAHAVLDAAVEADLQGLQLSREASSFLLDGWRLAGRPKLAMKGVRFDVGAMAALAELLFGVSLVYVEPGTFSMGSPEDEQGRLTSEGPLHEVTISRGFWMAATPVTQAQHEAATGHNPSHFKGGDRPVECVSWLDAVAFCRRLTETMHDMVPDVEFRLPTEAEWEYACRAGATSAFNDGSDCTEPDGKDPALDRLGWFRENSGRETHPVGEKQPNAWGLYDMHGNVWEWCEDHYHSDYEGAPDDGSAWVDKEKNGKRTGSGTNRVIRGGSWIFYARNCRCAYRDRDEPGSRDWLLGFRLVLAPSS